MITDDTRAWVRLPSGKRLDLLNPTLFDWEDEDLAIGLARTYRWGGHSAWPLPLSVAQHSLAVLALRREAEPTEKVGARGAGTLRIRVENADAHAAPCESARDDAPHPHLE